MSVHRSLIVIYISSVLPVISQRKNIVALSVDQVVGFEILVEIQLEARPVGHEWFDTNEFVVTEMFS
jgi:hypothetical protein